MTVERFWASSYIVFYRASHRQIAGGMTYEARRSIVDRGPATAIFGGEA